MLLKIYYILIIIVCSLDANSQITKAYWLVGGNASLDSREPGSISTYSSSDQLMLNASCNVGYFIADKIVIGIKPTYNGIWYFQDNPTVYQSNLLGVGPFVRYYLRDKDEKVNVFSELSYQYGKEWGNHSQRTDYTNRITPMLGCAAFINECIAVEITLGYSSIYYVGFKGANYSVVAGIGFQFHLIKI